MHRCYSKGLKEAENLQHYMRLNDVSMIRKCININTDVHNISAWLRVKKQPKYGNKVISVQCQQRAAFNLTARVSSLSVVNTLFFVINTHENFTCISK